MKKILIVYDHLNKEEQDSVSHVKSYLVNNGYRRYLDNTFRELKEKTDDYLVFPNATYYFLNIRKRNIEKYFKKHGLMDCVYLGMNCNSQKDFLSNIINDKGKIENYRILSVNKVVDDYKNIGGRKEVYVITNPYSPNKDIKKTNIFACDFQEGEHYNTRKEAGDVLIKQTELEIERLQEQLEKCQKVLKKFKK